MPFTLVRNDITKMTTDAIVNAANTELKRGGGVCGGIFKAAGSREMRDACKKLAPVKTGEAVITPGFALSAKYVIHAVGPVYRDGTRGEEQLLRSAYENSLRLAVENGCESIAFPLISSGIFNYPKEKALRTATSAIRGFLDGHDLDAYLVVWDKASFAVSKSLLGEVKSYIDDNWVAEQDASFDIYGTIHREAESSFTASDIVPQAAPEAESAALSLSDVIRRLGEPFSAALLRLIDASGWTDAEVYKRANIDRRLFSKIRGNLHYTPSKPTVLAFAVALELSHSQTAELLERAGFALSHSRKFDVIVEYFISRGKYDIYEINEVLFHYDQPLLGG